MTTIPGVDTYKIPDRVTRGWDQGGLNRVWISDITYLRTGEGWLYLAAVTDAHSRRILGWAIDSRMGTFLVAKALRMAHTLGGEVSEGVVFHADRGTEFTSDDMFAVCRDPEIWRSCSRSGGPVCGLRQCDGRERVGEAENFSSTTGGSGLPGRRPG